ncbi:MAG TPA: helix-turn-helix domain-containing protein [Smithellaceae bacterium]|nr:helix-turn-helix domain-containing protein [Smithellaceae bacterium]HRS89876.1 helix-turn-helix domain-containing protein [Smithellaceae bacterium]HRV26074.1 helix-turn-helix domain-containing protein [Smithellaceae bacterium]
MQTRQKKQKKAKVILKVKETPYAAVEEIMEKKLEDIATILSASGGRKSKIYEEVMSIVEKGLFKIALRRSDYVKSSAAVFLGMNRNTFTDKMAKLGMNCEKKKEHR